MGMSVKEAQTLLNLTDAASHDDVDRAWQRLALKYHPDRNPGDASAEAQFKRAQAARETAHFWVDHLPKAKAQIEDLINNIMGGPPKPPRARTKDQIIDIMGEPMPPAQPKPKRRKPRSKAGALGLLGILAAGGAAYFFMKKRTP